MAQDGGERKLKINYDMLLNRKCGSLIGVLAASRLLVLTSGCGVCRKSEGGEGESGRDDVAAQLDTNCKPIWASWRVLIDSPGQGRLLTMMTKSSQFTLHRWLLWFLHS